MTGLDRRSSLEKTTRRLRLRRDAQPQHLDRDGSDRGSLGRRSHQSRDPPRSGSESHLTVIRELSKKRLGCFATVLVVLHLKFSLWF